MAHTPPGRTRERVWRFVRERLLAGDPPTVREVQEAFGFRAVESARAHLEALVAAGLLEKEGAGSGRARARGYRLAESAFPFASPAPALVPVLGRVQAGALTTALEEAEGAVAVQSRLPAAELFALRVRGDSMRGAGILDGDLVVVRRQDTADDGQIVVAMVGEEATVKRLRKARARDGAVRVELHPENPAFDVIVPPPGEARILGRVTEVRRHLDPLSLPSWETGPPSRKTSPPDAPPPRPGPPGGARGDDGAGPSSGASGASGASASSGPSSAAATDDSPRPPATRETVVAAKTPRAAEADEGGGAGSGGPHGPGDRA